jgi:hypothetical protein
LIQDQYLPLFIRIANHPQVALASASIRGYGSLFRFLAGGNKKDPYPRLLHAWIKVLSTENLPRFRALQPF